LQFAALFSMTLAMQQETTPLQALEHAALFFIGGFAYLWYALAVAWMLRRRIKEQVLAEALYELARHVQIKAGFYDMQVDLKEQWAALIRSQTVLAERHQAARDMILRGRASERDQILVQVHYAMLDLYELVLSIHTDYARLRQRFADSDALLWMRDLIAKAALDIETIAFAVTSRRASVQRVSYTPELRALAGALKEMAANPDAVDAEARSMLRGAYHRILAISRMLTQLHKATRAQATDLQIAPAVDLTPFRTQQKYEWSVLRANLRWRSPIFRYSLRVLLAVSCGMLLAEHLPHGNHGYWIVLTIAVILKPTYSMTRQRRRDRVIGTLIGCVLTALVLHFTRAPAVLLTLMFIATAAAPAFVQIRYRYTSIAASMQVLLQISLLVPGSTHVVSERLVDTLIGAGIATLFSFVFPSWEYRALPQRVNDVLKAGIGYVGASRELLQGRAEDDFVYRLRRKQFTDSLSALSSALLRMRDEPASKQRAVDEIMQFILQNYLVAAQMAAIRLLLRNHEEKLPREAVNDWLQRACDATAGLLDAALNARDATAPPAPEAPAAAEAATAWTGWKPLQRRTRLLLADARAVAQQAALITTEMGKAHRSG
jgi:uncharacterized membrane protein YccC